MFAAPARAHDLLPGILAFVEDQPGELRMRFVPPVDSRGEAQELPIVLPKGCTRAADRVRCTDGFAGELAVGGMRGHAMKIYVSLEREGERRDWVLTSESPRITIGAPPRRIPYAQLAMFGALALALGTRRRRRFAVAMTTFVAAQLAVGFLGVGVPAIAAGVLVLARHAVAGGEMRTPAIAVALAFGAASPHPSLVVAAGELAAVAVTCVLLVRERGVVAIRAHRAAAYALGALAAYGLLRDIGG